MWQAGLIEAPFQNSRLKIEFNSCLSAREIYRVTSTQTCFSVIRRKTALLYCRKVLTSTTGCEATCNHVGFHNQTSVHSLLKFRINADGCHLHTVACGFKEALFWQNPILYTANAALAMTNKYGLFESG